MKINYDNDCAIIQLSRFELRSIVKFAREGQFDMVGDQRDHQIISGITGVFQDMTAQRVPRDDIMEVTI